MKTAILAGVALLALSACGQEASAPAAKAEPAATEPETAPSAPVSVKEAQRAAVDLAPYIGKYPFDVVAGHRFLDNPAVKAAIAAAVPDAKQRAAVQFDDNGLGLPIVKVDGGRILAWGGAKRAEDRYNWAVVIAPDGSKPEVCIYDGLGYDEDFQSSQWFEPGKASIMKQGKCPSADEDYPAAEIAAG
ncbi:hypothetical protein FHR22_004108 [Sphingopyxis panaciterrae]|uniref:hypothetical protein n=1 Tax=Sphingopyxis panaciterrae TaxID=363841 RepID=UPI00141F227D|nr:hypothetical protein [Sphingopyxis panaciterrae]NIJ39361.1 hypothetical protein [Sphingopyxis panaciterrae]